MAWAIWQTLTDKLSSVDLVPGIFEPLCQAGLIETAIRPLFPIKRCHLGTQLANTPARGFLKVSRSNATKSWRLSRPSGRAWQPSPVYGSASPSYKPKRARACPWVWCCCFSTTKSHVLLKATNLLNARFYVSWVLPLWWMLSLKDLICHFFKSCSLIPYCVFLTHFGHRWYSLKKNQPLHTNIGLL